MRECVIPDNSITSHGALDLCFRLVSLLAVMCYACSLVSNKFRCVGSRFISTAARHLPPIVFCAEQTCDNCLRCRKTLKLAVLCMILATARIGLSAEFQL